MLITSFSNLAYSEELLPKSLEKAQFENAIKSKDWLERYRAASFILEMPNLDTLWAAGLIMNGINIETNDPSPAKLFLSSAFTYSQLIINRFIFDLDSLGKATIPTLKNAIKKAKGKYSDCLKLALAFNSDPTVHEDIRLILMRDVDANMRLMAATALVEYDDSSDVPLLLNALSDTTRVVTKGDVYIPGKGFERSEYPVSSAAAKSLNTMGYKITKENGRYLLLKQKK
jgi:hypothetical protein